MGNGEWGMGNGEILNEEEALMESKTRMVEVPIGKLVQLENTRTDAGGAEVSELMQNMKRYGQLQPIGIRPGPSKGTWEVVFGNRRVFAAKKLGWKSVDALVVGATGSKESDIDFLIKNASENLQRVNPSFSEQGRLFHALIRKGLTGREIAARIGISSNTVANILNAYEKLPRHLRDDVKLNQDGRPSKGVLSIRTVNAVLNNARTYGVSESKSTQLLEIAKREGIDSGRAAKAIKLIAAKVPVEKAVNYLGSVKIVSVNFMFSEPAIDRVEKEYGCTVRDAIYQFVARSGKFPLAKIAPRVIVRKKV